MVASLRAACPFEDARAAGAVTHADLFFENPVKLPFLNIELPLLAFFFLAPILFLVVHAYTLVHLVMLTDKAKRFHQALRDRIGDDDSLPKVQRARRSQFATACNGNCRATFSFSSTRGRSLSSAAYAAETATRVPASTAPRRFTSPIAFAQMLHGLARRISPGADMGVRPKPMAMA